MCHNQQWGLVCENGGSWDNPSVQVTCTQLGIPSACKLFKRALCTFSCLLISLVPRSASRRLIFYDAPVILNDIACTGSEMSIINCTEDGYGSFTTCRDIAVAQCEGKLS